MVIGGVEKVEKMNRRDHKVNYAKFAKNCNTRIKLCVLCAYLVFFAVKINFFYSPHYR